MRTQISSRLPGHDKVHVYAFYVEVLLAISLKGVNDHTIDELAVEQSHVLLMRIKLSSCVAAAMFLWDGISIPVGQKQYSCGGRSSMPNVVIL